MTKKLLFVFIFAATAFGQVAVAPYRNARATFTDATGIPLADGCVFFYQGGTSTPLATYTDYTGNTQNSNPVILDSTGSANIWLGPSAYKIAVWSAGGTNCATGAQLWTIDQVPGNEFLSGTITGATISNSTISSSTISSPTITNPTITGGTIDNTPIGSTTPAAGAFTTLASQTIETPTNLATSQLNLNVNASVLPESFPLLWEGSSIGFGWNSQNDTYISSVTAGSGYTGTGTVTVSGGTCTTEPQIYAYVMPSGGLAFGLITPGSCTVLPTSIVISGFSTGSGASASLALYTNPYPNPWTHRVTTLPAMNGRVSSYTNDSVSGSTVFDVLGRYSIDNIATFCAQTNAIIAIDGGILGNSLAGGNGLSPGQGGTGSPEAPVPVQNLYSQWLALTHAYKAAGCKVIVTTMLPRGNFVTAPVTIALLETYRQQINQLIRSGTPGTDYDWLVDFGANVQDYNDYYVYSTSDQVHPNGSGQIVLAELFDAALRQSGLINAIGAPITGSGDQFHYGLSVTGNNQNYQANGWAVGYNGGTEYETIIGPSVGVRNSYTLQSCDYLTASCVNAIAINAAGVIQAPAINSPVISGSWCWTGSTACQDAHVSTCSTTSTQLNTCVVTVSWPASFADTNYRAVCGLYGANTFGGVANTGSKGTSSIQVNVINFTSGTALTSGTVECVGVHD